MRLIDAEKARTELVYFTCTTGIDEAPYEFASDIIDEQPTVDAIPIEWIKKWCLKNYPTYPRTITEELLKKTETWRMIEDWEKENESNVEC